MDLNPVNWDAVREAMAPEGELPTFSVLIDHIRHENNFTTRSFGDAIGIRSSTMFKIKSGRERLRAGPALEIAKMSGLPVETIMFIEAQSHLDVHRRQESD